MASLLALENAAIFGPAGAALLRFLGGPVASGLVIALGLLLWLVLPLALETLTSDDWTVIDNAFSLTDDSVPGIAPRSEFDALFRLIIAMASAPNRTGAT